MTVVIGRGFYVDDTSGVCVGSSGFATCFSSCTQQRKTLLREGEYTLEIQGQNFGECFVLSTESSDLFRKIKISRYAPGARRCRRPTLHPRC